MLGLPKCRMLRLHIESKIQRLPMRKREVVLVEDVLNEMIYMDVSHDMNYTKGHFK